MNRKNPHPVDGCHGDNVARRDERSVTLLVHRVLLLAIQDYLSSRDCRQSGQRKGGGTAVLVKSLNMLLWRSVAAVRILNWCLFRVHLHSLLRLNVTRCLWYLRKINQEMAFSCGTEKFLSCDSFSCEIRFFRYQMPLFSAVEMKPSDCSRDVTTSWLRTVRGAFSAALIGLMFESCTAQVMSDLWVSHAGFLQPFMCLMKRRSQTSSWKDMTVSPIKKKRQK